MAAAALWNTAYLDALTAAPLDCYAACLVVLGCWQADVLAQVLPKAAGLLLHAACASLRDGARTGR